MTRKKNDQKKNQKEEKTKVVPSYAFFFWFLLPFLFFFLLIFFLLPSVYKQSQELVLDNRTLVEAVTKRKFSYKSGLFLKNMSNNIPKMPLFFPISWIFWFFKVLQTDFSKGFYGRNFFLRKKWGIFEKKSGEISFYKQCDKKNIL